MVSDLIACLWVWVWMVDVFRRSGFFGAIINLFYRASFFLSSFILVSHGFMCSGPRIRLRDAPSGGARGQKLEAGSPDSVCKGGRQGLGASAFFLFRELAYVPLSLNPMGGAYMK